MTAASNKSRPVKYGVMLFPGFQALDVFGPLDVLNLLSSKADFKPLELVMLAATLDPVSTSARPGHKFSQSIVPTHTFESAPDDLDVLLVPGGGGARQEATIAPVMEFVKKAYPKSGYLLTVCTGSVIVAKTGVMDGKRATSNKMAWKWATTSRPEVNWVREARWVTDGNLWTSSGISAGIDMAYAFVADLYGEDVAQEIADQSEYRRNTDPDDDPFAKYAEA